MNYKVFLIRADSDQFLFSFNQVPNLRPKKGDVLTDPLTFEQFKILRDESVLERVARITDDGSIRITDDGFIRITDEGSIKITDEILDSNDVTHNYFVTPANNPQRIASYSTAGVANDQTLRQLFR